MSRRSAKRREKSLLLAKRAGLRVHILGEQQLLHFCCLPFEVLHSFSSDGDQQVQIIEIFVVSQAIFQKIPGTDGTVQVVKVRIGVAGFPDLAAVDAQLLAQFADHAVFWLPGEENVQVDAITGIDQETEPPGRDLRLITV